MPERRSQNLVDHDLLIELRTEMRGVREDIQKLSDGTALRLSTLENDHVTVKGFSDHETRIRFIEKYVWGAIAVVAVVEPVAIAVIVYYLTK